MRASLKTAIASLLLGAMLSFIAGCSKHPSDATIAQDVQSKVAADPETKDSTVSVTAKGGKVTLKGTARSAAAQQKMEQLARQEPGISDVDNQTVVPPPIVVPAGTSLIVTVDQALSSKTSQSGQTFLATVAQPVTVDGELAIPKGASVTGTVLRAKEKGKIKGEGELALGLDSVTLHGKNYTLHTESLDSTVKGKGKRTAVTTGGGAAGGALIGGLAGGGKGAGIGALVGAAGGLLGGAFTGNKQIEIPAESALTFTLSDSLTLPPRMK